MSLIEQALRKIQDPTLRQFQAAAQPQTPTKAPAATKAEPPAEPAVHSWPTAPGTGPAASPTSPAIVGAAIAVLALTAVLIVGGVTWMGRTSRAPVPTSDGAPVAGAPRTGPPDPRARPAAPVRPAAQASSPGYVLSGVVEGLGDPYAVINGLVVRAGDGIEGATVVSIGQGTVTLRRDDGSQLALRVSP